MTNTQDIQARCWNHEYDAAHAIPTSSQQKVSTSALALLEYLQSQHRVSGVFLDIGCGRGNVARFFADNGFRVCGFDFSEVALNYARKAYIDSKRLFFVHCDARLPWPFRTGAFDVALDGATMINMTTDETIHNYLKETRRVIKPSGVLMVVAPVLPDEFYSSLVQQQGTRIVMHGQGIKQRIHTAEELQTYYAPYFRIMRADVVRKKNKVYGAMYERTLCRLILEGDAQ